ncbi:MAG: PD40 domain-containing protein [Myxococcales bacterium]|nr:PD40 domain-containing protein [Myxococcales bacterium]
MRAFALAPDGERVAYVVPEGEGVALYLKDPGGEPRRRRTFSEVSRLRFSPDGEVLLVGAGVGAGDVVLPIALAMSAADGAEANGAIDLDAVTRADWAWDMAWAADGGSYAALPQTYVAEVVLHDRDGTRRQVVPLEVPAAWRREDGAEGFDLRRFLRQVDLAPGGDEVLVVAGDAEQGDLLLQPIAGGAAAVVHLPGLSIRHARYAGARRVVLAQVEDDLGERRLVRLRLAEDGQLVGEPEILLAPFGTALPFDLSRDGRRVAFVDAKWRAHLFRYDREGEGLRRRALTSGTRRDERPALSPDGRRVAFIRQQGGLSELHAMPSEGGPTRRLSDLPAVPVAPAWSPDGETLAFVARDEGTARVWLLRGDAPAVPLEPTVPLAASREIAWAPGPELLLSMGAGINVAVVDPVKGRLRLLLDDPAPVAIRSARWASDGRIAAFRAGREWGLALLEGAAWRTFAPRRVSPILGFAPDGEAVLVLEGDRVSRIDVKTGAETLWGDLDVEENAGVSVATDARSAIVSVRDSIRDVERVDLE